MTFQFLDFLDPNDGIPTWAILLALALLSLAAALPTPERVANGPGASAASSSVAGSQLASW